MDWTGAEEAPCAVGLMSGPNAPLETALVWFGWRVRTYEIKGTHFNEPADLLDPDVQAEAEADSEAADFLEVAMDCSTFSRIREIPRPGITKARPLRDAEHPRGLPRLHEKGAERELHKVTQHNKLLDWSTDQLRAHHRRKGGWLSENPENSLYWIQQAVHELSESEDVVSYRYSACAHGAARAKKQRIDSNIPGIASQRARCHSTCTTSTSGSRFADRMAPCGSWHMTRASSLRAWCSI